jgi:hypothetical protein
MSQSTHIDGYVCVEISITTRVEGRDSRMFVKGVEVRIPFLWGRAANQQLDACHFRLLLANVKELDVRGVGIVQY